MSGVIWSRRSWSRSRRRSRGRRGRRRWCRVDSVSDSRTFLRVCVESENYSTIRIVECCYKVLEEWETNESLWIVFLEVDVRRAGAWIPFEFYGLTLRWQSVHNVVDLD